jgi:hypothetical protein
MLTIYVDNVDTVDIVASPAEERIKTRCYAHKALPHGLIEIGWDFFALQSIKGNRNFHISTSIQQEILIHTSIDASDLFFQNIHWHIHSRQSYGPRMPLRWRALHQAEPTLTHQTIKQTNKKTKKKDAETLTHIYKQNKPRSDNSSLNKVEPICET